MSDVKPPIQRLVLVTGPSGAGRSTAINVLEDIGFEAIDNMPLTLLPRLLDGPPTDGPLALGVDARNRDFSTAVFLETIETLGRHSDVALEVLFVDCRPDVLTRRFSETRRRHPLAPEESPELGIEREIDLLKPIQVRADYVIDTTELSPHDLRSEMGRWFGSGSENALAVSLHSFSYKRGIPRGIDTVFDCRFLRNPYWDEALRALDGRSVDVVRYIMQDPRFGTFFDQVSELVKMLLPAYVDEGKAHFSIAFGCTGGQHRSVAVAERLASALAEDGWQVSKRHRELERRAAMRPAQ